MPQVTVSDGSMLHYDTFGAGQPLMLVHSLGFDGSLWQGTAAVGALVDAGRGVVTVDLRGHGRSTRWHDPARLGLDLLAQDLVELADHLGWSTFDVAAYSLGSRVALRLLQCDKRVRRAVLGGIGSGVLHKPSGDAPRPVAFAPAMAEEAAVRVERAFPYLQARVADGRTDPQALVALLASDLTFSHGFGLITAEVLLLSGSQDDDPRVLAAAIPSAEVRLVDAHHGNTMDHPDFVPALVQFLLS